MRSHFLGCIIVSLSPTFALGQIYTSGSGLTTTGSGTSTNIKFGGALTENANLDLGSAYKFNLSKSAVDFFSVLNNGNIGIANSSPSYKLDVVGQTRFNTAVGIGTSPSNNEAVGAAGLAVVFNHDQSQNYTSGISAINSLNLTADASDISNYQYGMNFVTQKTGNYSYGNLRGVVALPYIFGSGTLTNVVGFLVSPSSFRDPVNVGSVTNAYGMQLITPDRPFGGASTIGTTYGAHIANMGTPFTTTSYGLFVAPQTGATNSYAAIFEGGNVGIGTKVPMSSVHVNQIAGTSKGITITGDETYQTGNGLSDKGIRIALGYNRSGNRQIWMGDVDAFGSPTLGLFRCFTGTPIPYLDATSGDGSSRLNLGLGSATSNIIIGSDDISAVQPASKLSVMGNLSVGFDIPTTSAPVNGALIQGNVGIGTTDTKGYRLAVNGNAIFTKVKVQSYGVWADYVFDDDYKLRPITELEKFIQQNRHLPEVPTTTEVEQLGIDLGSNQIILLKKVEELTLYLIQQNKEIEELKSKIKKLEAKGR